ncbi:MAG: DUF2165 family protein [Hyphomonas sp.]|nr:DUF2165 family protein [Hyphomonas sp.]
MRIIENLKVVFALCAGLMALLYAINNLLNLEEAYAYVAFTFGQTGHEAYPSGIVPPITSPVLNWIGLSVIILTELAAGALALWGGYGMFRTRGDRDAFTAAKGRALLGAGLGVLVWFGYFHVIASAGMQLWQTEAAPPVLGGAFQYAVFCFLTVIFLAQKED